MSKLEQLIEELCPNGVEYKTLESCCKILKGKQLNKDKLLEEDNYPAYNGGVSYSGFTNEYNVEENTTIISQGGASAGFVQFITTKFWANAHCYYLKPNLDVINNRYLFHFVKSMQNKLMECQHGAGIPALKSDKISKLSIPLPPLPVQHEIVRILDIFSEYTKELKKELTEELTMRKKQYEYYRDSLLSFGDEVEWKTLGEVSEISTGSKPEMIFQHTNTYEYINAGTTNSGYTENYNCYGNTVTTPSRGQGGIGFVGYQKEKFFLGPLCYKISSNTSKILTKYIFYYLKRNSDLILKIKNEGGVPSVNKSDLRKLPLSIPPLEEQQRIVDILDRFDTLCNDISKGLPAEIEARKKQYEYYRDKLLDFKNINEEV